MKAAVSGLNTEGKGQDEGYSPSGWVPGQPAALASLQHSPWGSAWRPQLHRCVEQLQVLVFYLRAPAAPGVRYHRQPHHVASHIHMQGQLVREVRLHQGALWEMGWGGAVRERELPSSAAFPHTHPQVPWTITNYRTSQEGLDEGWGH